MAENEESVPVPVQVFDARNSKQIDQDAKPEIQILVRAENVVAAIGDTVIYKTEAGDEIECRVVEQTECVSMRLIEQ